MPPARTSSAAARPRARRSPPPRRASSARPPLRIRWERVGRVVLVIVLAVVLGLYLQQGIAYLSVRSQADEQQSVVSRLARQNARLSAQEKALNNPAVIQRYARQLGMVQPGERPYVVTGLPGS